MNSAFFVLLLTIGAGSGGSEQEDSSALMLDTGSTCGQMCVFAVARYKDLPVNFADVQRSLGPGDDAGMHSMGELCETAKMLGMY